MDKPTFLATYKLGAMYFFEGYLYLVVEQVSDIYGENHSMSKKDYKPNLLPFMYTDGVNFGIAGCLIGDKEIVSALTIDEFVDWMNSCNMQYIGNIIED